MCSPVSELFIAFTILFVILRITVLSIVKLFRYTVVSLLNLSTILLLKRIALTERLGLFPVVLELSFFFENVLLVHETMLFIAVWHKTFLFESGSYFSSWFISEFGPLRMIFQPKMFYLPNICFSWTWGSCWKYKKKLATTGFLFMYVPELK